MQPARALACNPMARLIFGLVVLILGQAWSAPATGATPDAGAPAALRERYVELKGHLANSPFHQPLTLRSQDADDHLEGDVYAVIDHPIQVVRNALVSLAGIPLDTTRTFLHLRYSYAYGTLAYLAIDAYLGALSVRSAERPEKSMRAWFASTERYALQLHELDVAQYLATKRAQYRRQETRQ